MKIIGSIFVDDTDLAVGKLNGGGIDLDWVNADIQKAIN